MFPTARDRLKRYLGSEPEGLHNMVIHSLIEYKFDFLLPSGAAGLLVPSSERNNWHSQVWEEKLENI